MKVELVFQILQSFFEFIGRDFVAVFFQDLCSLFFELFGVTFGPR